MHLNSKMPSMCYKYWRRNFNLSPNTDSRESSFLFRGCSAIQLNHKKTEQTKQDRYFNETNEKFGDYRKQLMDQVLS